MINLIKQILSFNESQTDKEREDYINAVTAFAVVVNKMSNNRHHDKSIIIYESFDKDQYINTKAVSDGVEGFSLREDLFISEDRLYDDLRTVFHECAHTYCDKDAGKILFPDDYEILIRGEIIHKKKEDVDFCREFEKKWLVDGVFDVDTPQDDLDRYTALAEENYFISNIFNRVYYNQSNEVRARAWEEILMSEFLRLANNAQNCGMIGECEKKVLDLLNEDERYFQREKSVINSYVPPVEKEDIARFRAIITNTTQTYLSILPSYLGLSETQQMIRSMCDHCVNPITYVARVMEIYYDDEIAHNLVGQLLDSMERPSDFYGQSIMRLYLRSDIRFTEEELHRFAKDIEFDTLVEMENIKNNVQSNTTSYEVFNSDCICREQRKIPHLPNRTIREIIRDNWEVNKIS